MYDPDTATVEFLKHEFVNKKLITDDNSEVNATYDKIIADLVFRINDRVYNIEFQTRHDKTMLCRIAEYQFGILSDRLSEEKFLDKYEGSVFLPRMIVVQLEKSRNVPDYYKLWFVSETTGDKLMQKFPIVKLWEDSVKDLSENGKHLLLPFKTIEFRKAVKNNVMDEKTTKEFAEYNKNIRKIIHMLASQEKLSAKAEEQMLTAHNHMIKYFLDRFIKKGNPAREDVENMLVVTERPPSMTELIMVRAKEQIAEAKRREAEAQKIATEAQKREAEARREIAKKEAEARQEIAKKEAEARREIAKKEAEAREIAKKEAEARREIAKKEAEARQEINIRDAEIAKLNAALIKLMRKFEQGGEEFV